MTETRVVLVALDGFPPEAVSPKLTPALWSLSAEGARAVDGGRAPLPSSTYPSFASLLTGRGPRGHGVRTTARRDGELPAWAGLEAVRTTTLFDACRAAGRGSAFVAGDHHLYRVLRADRADTRWPDADRAPAGVPLDAHGYAVNAAVLPAALEACEDARLSFVFAHLNETDTLGHDLGPRHPDTLSCYRSADAAVGRIARALRPRWDDTVLIVMSDHGMEERMPAPPIWLPADDRIVDVLADGGAALVRHAGDGAALGDDLVDRGLVQAWTAASEEALLVVAPPRRIFGATRLPLGGFHGGRATIPTLAVVSGGHPAVGRIARGISADSPSQADWATTIASLLGLVLPDAAGLDLVCGRVRAAA